MSSDEIFEDDELLEGDDDDTEETDGDDEDDAVIDAPVAPGLTDEDADLDDLTNDSDVELALDEMMAERVKVVSDDDEDDEPTAAPADDSADLGEAAVLPQQDDEFRCTSCRLLKKKSQLARPGTQICRDCV